jgi:DNA-binding PadR family transcriptional regulator
MTRSITQAYKFEKHRIFEINDQWITRSSVALAREIGDNEARLLLQLEYLIATSHNERDGRLWTYQSLSDLETMFPWSKPTIQRAIKSLEKQNLITVTGKYNRKKYDRTNWFAINFEGAARLKSIKIATDQNELRSIQNETRIDQNETATDQNETTIPKRSTERSTKRSSKNNFENEHDLSNETTNVLAKDLDRSGETVPPCENSAATNADSIIDGEYVDDSAALIVADNSAATARKQIDKIFENATAPWDQAAKEKLYQNHNHEDILGCMDYMTTSTNYKIHQPLTPSNVLGMMNTFLVERDNGKLRGWTTSRLNRLDDLDTLIASAKEQEREHKKPQARISRDEYLKRCAENEAAIRQYVPACVTAAKQQEVEAKEMERKRESWFAEIV